MTGFILESRNMPFTIALTMMLMIAVIEGVTTVIGMGLSSMIETLLPDLDMDADMDSSELISQGGLTRILGWFRIGQVPFLVILIAFLTIFGLIGLLLQSLALEFSGSLIPALGASGIALVLGLPVVKTVVGIIARIMPKDETQAVSEQSFIGRVAVITLGKAVKGKPAQAKLKDKFGATHYVMVEPDLDDEVFQQGEHVLIVQQTVGGYKGIRNSVSALDDI